MTYPGGKGASGAVQTIINQQPPHSAYIEPFVGGGPLSNPGPYNSPCLLTPVRACCACGRSIPLRAMEPPEVPVLSLSTLIYRRGNRPIQKAAGHVRICEPCLVEIVSNLGAPTKAGKALLRCMAENIGPCLIEILSEDSATTEAPSGPHEAQCSL